METEYFGALLQQEQESLQDSYFGALLQKRESRSYYHVNEYSNQCEDAIRSSRTNLLRR